MRIALVVETLFYPTNHTGANRFNALARAAVARGHEVDVFAVGEESLHTLKQPPFVDHGGRVRVHYARRTKLNKAKLVLRLWRESYTAFQLHWRALRRCDADIVLVTAPPLMQLIVCGFLRLLRPNRLHVLDLRDLIWRYFEYRDSPFGRLFSAIFGRLAGWAIRRFDHVVCTTDAQWEAVRHLARAGGVLRNGIDESRLRQLSKLQDGREGAESPGLVVAYAGSIGFPQNLKTLIDAALLLRQRDRSDIRFVIAGEGPEYDRLKAWCEDEQLISVQWLGEISWETCMEKVYGPAHVLYAQLRDSPVFSTAMPTKLIEYFATGREVVYGGRGEGADILEGVPGCHVIPPDDAQALSVCLENLVGNRGKYSRVYSDMKARWGREALSIEYVRLLEGLAPKHPGDVL